MSRWEWRSGASREMVSLPKGIPLRNERQNVVLIFPGKELPAPGTAVRLKERGDRFETSGSSNLFHLYEEGPAFLPYGMRRI